MVNNPKNPMPPDAADVDLLMLFVLIYNSLIHPI
jgi:hypothetical protein